MLRYDLRRKIGGRGVKAIDQRKFFSLCTLIDDDSFSPITDHHNVRSLPPGGPRVITTSTLECVSSEFDLRAQRAFFINFAANVEEKHQNQKGLSVSTQNLKEVVGERRR